MPVDVPRARSEKLRHAAKTEKGRTVIDLHVVLALGRASYWNLIVPVVLNQPGGSGPIVNLTVLDVGIVRIGALYKTGRKRPSEKEAERQGRVRKVGWAAREGRRDNGQCSFRTGGDNASYVSKARLPEPHKSARKLTSSYWSIVWGLKEELMEELQVDSAGSPFSLRSESISNSD